MTVATDENAATANGPGGQMHATQHLQVAAWLMYKGHEVEDVIVAGSTAWIVFENTEEVKSDRLGFPQSPAARYMNCYRTAQDMAFDAVRGFDAAGQQEPA
ncbi:MAG: hypothetical protein ACOC7J_07605 [Armatimonadota bacterium]